MRNNLLYTVCEFICIFGIGFDAMLCRYARKKSKHQYNKTAKHSRLYSGNCIIVCNRNVMQPDCQINYKGVNAI